MVISLKKFWFSLVVFAVILLSGQALDVQANPINMPPPEAFVLTSPAFKNGGMMPYRFRYHADNKSPSLQWENVPVGTVSFSITCIDYDPPANGYTHWDISNIPANYRELPEGIPSVKNWKDGVLQKTPWIGPYPPNGVHSYHFEILAKDANRKTLAKAKLIGRSD